MPKCILKKYISTKSILNAVKKEKKQDPDEIWLDNNESQDEKPVGFSK